MGKSRNNSIGNRPARDLIERVEDRAFHIVKKKQREAEYLERQGLQKRNITSFQSKLQMRPEGKVYINKER